MPNPTPRYDGRYRRADVLPIADRATAWLSDVCTIVTVAGSIRREAPSVKDIEIVALPGDLARYNARLDKLVHSGQAARGRVWGDKYRPLIVAGVKIDLFAADPHNYGYILWLRTGPGGANTYAMRQLQHRAHIRCRDGYVYDAWPGRDDERRLSVPDEHAMFALWRLPYMPPSQRSEDAYRRAAARRALPYGARIPAPVDNAPPTQTSLF
jgi:DNA polymerase/3'-5' exonuclease PolX